MTQIDLVFIHSNVHCFLPLQDETKMAQIMKDTKALTGMGHDEATATLRGLFSVDC